MNKGTLHSTHTHTHQKPRKQNIIFKIQAGNEEKHKLNENKHRLD